MLLFVLSMMVAFVSGSSWTTWADWNTWTNFTCSDRIREVHVRADGCMSSSPKKSAIFCTVYDNSPGGGDEVTGNNTVQCEAANFSSFTETLSCFHGYQDVRMRVASLFVDVVNKTSCPSKITPFKTDVDQNERNEVPWSVHIYKYVQPVIVLGGLAGNILSFLVMSSKYMKQFSFSVYLKTLGVLDSLVLLHYGMTYIDIINYNQSIFTFRMTSYAACMVYPYLIRGIQLSSAWCVVAFSIDRALAIGKPFFAYQHMSTARSRLVVCCVILAAMFSQIYHPILLDKRSSFCHDPFSFPLTSSGLHAMELLVLTSRSTLLMFLPFAIVLACNISVITAVRRRSFLRETNRDLSTDSSQGLNKVRRQDTDRKLSIKLLSISITFLLLSLPEVIVVIMDFKNILGRVDSWYSQHTEFRSIASMIFSLNFAINFLLYGLSFKKRILLWPACCTCLSKLNTGKPCPVRSRKDTPPLVLHLI